MSDFEEFEKMKAKSCDDGSKIYELWEFANEPCAEDTYSSRKVLVFKNENDLDDYVAENDFYGKCFVFDIDEWSDYHSNFNDSTLLDIPEPLEEYTVPC